MKADNPLLKIDAAAVVLLGVLTGAAYFIGASPILEARAAALAQERAVKQREEEAAQTEQALHRAEARLALVNAELRSSAIRLESLSRTNPRVADLTNLATSQRLEINEIRLGQPEVDVRYTRVPIRITGSGTYLSCALFLHELRNRFKDTGVTAFELDGDPTGEAASIRFIFDLVWYTAPETRASAESAGGA